MKYNVLLSFFIFLVLLMPILFTSPVSALSDTRVYNGGGDVGLRYSGNNHILTNGDDIVIASIGYNGDSNLVAMMYSDDDYLSGVWTEGHIRYAGNDTTMVSIARDSYFNIHAIYSEYNPVANKYYVFYKFFKWSDKTWYLSPNALIERNATYMGMNLSTGGHRGSTHNAIGVSYDGKVYVAMNEQDAVNRKLNFKRYNTTLNAWDLTATLNSNSVAGGFLNYAYLSMLVDYPNNIYITFAKNQDGHYSPEVYYDSYIIHSPSGGNNWNTVVQMENKTYPYTTIPTKLIMDENNIMHRTFYSNFTGNENYILTYAKSGDYGLTWDLLNLTDSGEHTSLPTLSIDENNRVYFLYCKRNDIYDYTNLTLYGRKYEDNILGDEVRFASLIEYQTFPNLYCSQQFNEYQSSGVIGVYEDRSITNYGIRLIKYGYRDFLVGNFTVEISPIKDPYYTLDTIDIHVIINELYEDAWWRVINATGVYVDPIGTEYMWLLHDMWYTKVIPNGYGIGTWQVQCRPDTSTWGASDNYYFDFNVALGLTDYYISANPSWIAPRQRLNCEFSAFANEQYNISLWYVNGNRYIQGRATPRYEVDQNVTLDYVFMIERNGRYVIYLRNLSSDEIYAVSNTITVSPEPPNNQYTTTVNDWTIYYDDNPMLCIHRDGREPFLVYIYNENDELINARAFNDDDVCTQTIFTIDDVGTCYIQVFDEGGNPDDFNALTEYFEVLDRYGLTGDPVTDAWITIPLWARAILGALITLGFTFLPLVLIGTLDKIKFKIDVPPVAYAISGGVGVTFCMMIGLWGFEIMFFICVIAIVTILITYLWKQKGE